MRFIITLRVNARKFGRLLPLNYQYEMSAAIYKTLSSCSEDFASWFHNNGFKTDEGKQPEISPRICPKNIPAIINNAVFAMENVKSCFPTRCSMFTSLIPLNPLRIIAKIMGVVNMINTFKNSD